MDSLDKRSEPLIPREMTTPKQFKNERTTMQKSQRGVKRVRGKKYSKINKNSNKKKQKKDANFSSLTHLKAALVGGIGGWLVRWLVVVTK